MQVKESYQDISTPTGVMRVHVFQPNAGGKFPGLLMFSEIFQVTGPIRRTATVLASHGYIVACPEIYHEMEPLGTVLGYDDEGSAKGNAYKIQKEISAYDSDARAVLDYLKSLENCTGKLGVFGVCIGGHLAFRAAMNPDVLATAALYATDIHKKSLGKGMNDNSLERAGDIKGELMHIWGRQDPHVSPEGRTMIRARLEEVGANFTWFEFNNVHAFMRDEGPRYDPATARVCWDLVFEMFHRKLCVGL